MMFTSKRGGRCFAKDPAVVHFDDKYFLYFSDMPNEEEEKNGSSLEVGIAFSYDMENWHIYGTLPKTQECERKGIGAPGVIVLDGKVHLFYQTYGNWKNDAICHAVSYDGFNFVKDDTNPIFHPGIDWCAGRAIDADVCVFGDELFLYYATRDSEMKIQMVGAASAPLGSKFCRDDFKELVRAPILFPTLDFEQSCIEAPATVVNDGKIYMFYGGAYNCSPQQIGCAVSADGVNFERLFKDNPFITNGKAGTWNSSESGHPFAFRDEDGRGYLFYQGSNDGGSTWYITKTEINFTDGGIPYEVE